MLKLFLYNQSINQLNGNDVEVYGSYAYVRNTQQIYLAMFNLRLIQLLTFIPRDLFFLTHFQTLYNIYAKAILLLIPLTYLETAEYNFFMSEEEMIEYLRDEGDDQTHQQDLNRKMFEDECQQNSEQQPCYGINLPYPNKYKFKLNEVLKKKIGPILKNTSKYQRLFMTSMNIHGRALELRYFLNNSIMHVFEAEQNYDTMNKLWNDQNLIVKGKKVFFNTVVVSLHELNEDPITSDVPSPPKTVPNTISKTMSTGNLSNDYGPGKRNRALRHRHSMRSMKSMSQYDLLAFNQRNASISRATIASAASSSTIFSALYDHDNETPPSMKRNTSSLLNMSLANDERLLKNIYSINETIMSTSRAQKIMAKKEERRASRTSAKKSNEIQETSDSSESESQSSIDDNYKNTRNADDSKEEKKEEKKSSRPLTSNSKDHHLLQNMISKMERPEEEEKTEDNTEHNPRTTTDSTEEPNKNNKDEKEVKSNRHKREKSERSSISNKKKENKNANRDEDDNDDDDDDDENAYDDFYSSDDGSSSSSGYGYYIHSDNKYTISQDFSIRNTLPKNNNKSSLVNSKAKKGNTYQQPEEMVKSTEPTDEDLFIDFILYHTDIAKSPEKSKQSNNNNTNDTNTTKSNSSQSKSHSHSQSSPPRPRPRPPLLESLYMSALS